ncbi:hypothetical protein Cpap_2461 [Ruminiclostridium papyrosolvens DSM 2782]|uniref:Lipoprotein n=1 Tax=Ruminiclostridium papyrosolvens DSM 2782 TaxID=588581 RepID=F1TBA5_9FIRM|nr:hypothetical protein [Ruminiclostridium papyrosolvens]EGD48309.1 hypothetical protein Cpap_2461 [Ruminiclostridium papyrosolvens DSM 2782]WES34186.1 hypothetical protein P0092_20890 [Ruminiclostridium papyrosolvens DSM 2782]
MKTLSGALLISTGCIMILILKALQIICLDSFFHADSFIIWFVIFMNLILGILLIIFDNMPLFQKIKNLCTLKVGLTLLAISLVTALLGLRRFPEPIMQFLSAVFLLSIVIIIINLICAIKNRKRV